MNLIELFQYDFFINALMAGLLICIPAGIIGSLVVVNRLVFSTEGIAHSAFAGIGIAVLTGISPYLGATFSSIVMALIISILTSDNKERSDSIIGVIMALSMAVGVICLNAAPGYKTEPMNYLFGNILTIGSLDIWITAIFSMFLILFFVFKYKQILMISYDPIYCKSKGFNVKAYNVLIYILIALTVIIIVKMVGLILLIALITIPAYIVEKYSSSLGKMMLYSVLMNMFSVTVGLLFSMSFDIATGGTIVIISGTIFLIDKLVYSYSRYRSSKKR